MSSSFSHCRCLGVLRQIRPQNRRNTFGEKVLALKEVPHGQEPVKKPVTPDPGDRTDWGSHAQTEERWKGNPEKEQRPADQKPDLEKWHKTTTH